MIIANIAGTGTGRGESLETAVPLIDACVTMNSLPTSGFSIPTAIRFGHGQIDKLPEYLASLGAGNPLVVTDGGLTKTDVYKTVTEILESAPQKWGAFNGVSPNPTEENIEAGAAAYRNGGHDSLIALGGGSAIDAAKAIVLRVALGAPLGEITTGMKPNVVFPRLIAIPTTAGTGSEVGRATVIIMGDSGRKAVLFDPRLMPSMAILDPDLTLNLPPFLTAATGMDAFTHCLESYVSKEFHPIADSMALGGLGLVILNLPRAYQDGQDREARGYMMIAASMGALAFQKDLGAAHSMAHPLSSISGLHHGLANAVVLPYVVEFNLGAAEERYARVAAIFDPKNALLPAAEAARKTVVAIRELNKVLGIPATLKEAGVSESALDALARDAEHDGCHLTNPRACTLEDFQKLFRCAFDGTSVDF